MLTHLIGSKQLSARLHWQWQYLGQETCPCSAFAQGSMARARGRRRTICRWMPATRSAHSALQTCSSTRRGEDLTAALRQLKERSAEAFAESLSRLDRFADQQVQKEFADRVERALCGEVALLPFTEKDDEASVGPS